MAWAVNLLLEVPDSHSCQLTLPDMQWGHLRVNVACSGHGGPRLQSTQKGLVILQKATFEAAYVSQDCSAGWCYKAFEQYRRPKEQNIILIFVFFEN